MGYTDLGTGQGRLYAVQGGIIKATDTNTRDGVRIMKELGLKSRALALGQRGTFTIKIDEITDSGTISAVTVNAVDQIPTSINYDVGEEIDVANAIATAIMNYTPATGPNYTAINVGDLVVGYAPVGASTAINGDSVGVSNSGDITITITAVSGVPDQTQIYSTTHGYQFYIDSDPNAPLLSISGAEEITKFIVPQTLDGALPAQIVELEDDIATTSRVGAISFVKLQSQSGDSDTCIGINPQGYADNDLVYVCAEDSDTTITFEENENGNFLLKDAASFISNSDVGNYILFRHISGVFIELMRSGGAAAGGLLEMTYGQGLAAIAASTLVPGTQYLITDRGDRGLILTAITTNRFSLEGQFIAAVPDYQNTTGNFIGDWWSGLTPSVGQICTYADGTQYINTTGTNTSTNPATDTTNWDVLDRTTNINYIVEVHDVRFNYTADRVVFRADQRGNTVSMGDSAHDIFPLVAGISTLDFFWWGKTNISGNHLIDLAINRSVFYGIISFTENMLERSYLTSTLSESYLFRAGGNTIEGRTPIYSGGVFLDSSVAAVLFHNEVKLHTGSASSLILASSVKLNISGSGGLSYCTIHSFIHTELTIEAQVSGLSLVLTGKGGAINAVSTISSVLSEGNLVSIGESDLPIPVDVTSETELSLLNQDIYGVILLESANSTETIDSLVDCSPVLNRVTLKPEEGTAITFLGTDASSPVDGSILIPPVFWDDSSPSDSEFTGQLTLDGDNGDYCEVIIVRLDESTVYSIVEKVIQL